jgi:exodeoxyribonuclease VII small subunit
VAPLKNNSSDGRPLLFEEAMAQLEQVVASLEEGRCALSDSLAHYERGVKLLRECYELLSLAERRIEVLSGFDAQGNPVTEPFPEPESAPLNERAGQSGGRRAPPERRGGSREERTDEIPF